MKTTPFQGWMMKSIPSVANPKPVKDMTVEELAAEYGHHYHRTNGKGVEISYNRRFNVNNNKYYRAEFERMTETLRSRPDFKKA